MSAAVRACAPANGPPAVRRHPNRSVLTRPPWLGLLAGKGNIPTWAEMHPKWAEQRRETTPSSPPVSAPSPRGGHLVLVDAATAPAPAPAPAPAAAAAGQLHQGAPGGGAGASGAEGGGTITVQFAVPANATAGQHMSVPIPGGKTLTVVVPPGAMPGTMLQVEANATSPRTEVSLQRPTAAIPVENPCCSCELTRVR